MRASVVSAVLCLLLGLGALGSRAQDSPPELPVAIEKLRLKLNPELEPWSPEQVFERVAEHLATVEGRLLAATDGGGGPAATVATQQRALYEISFLRYFSLAEVPRAGLPAATAALFRTVNEASAAPLVWRPQPVKNTANRIFWIDLRWLCWTTEAFEKVSLEDFYYREPLVPSASKALDYVRKRIGNGVLRGDWFTFYTGDTSLFLKSGAVKADNAFYYTLLYATNQAEVTKTKQVVRYTYQTVNAVWPGGADKNGVYHPAGTRYTYQKKVPVKTSQQVKQKGYGRPPKNEAEFLSFWGVDSVDKSLRFQAEIGAVIDEGDSGVSWQNRVYTYRQALTGKYYRTFDVFVTAGTQDFIEALPIPPRKFDAGELIFQSLKGAQYYLLVNGKNERVEFADPRLVHDQVSGKPFVLTTWKSCVQCHVDGIISAKNEIPRMIKSGADLRAKDPYTAQNIRAFYLRKLNKKVKADQEAFQDFMLEATGLTTTEAITQYKQHRSWYAAPVTLTQAAREVGATVAEFCDALSVVTKGRLGRLIMDGRPVPRFTWERGLYQEAFLLVIEYRKAVNRDRQQRGLPLVPTHSYTPPQVPGLSSKR